jgi:hypothetical protein
MHTGCLTANLTIRKMTTIAVRFLLYPHHNGSPLSLSLRLPLLSAPSIHQQPSSRTAKRIRDLFDLISTNDNHMHRIPGITVFLLQNLNTAAINSETTLPADFHLLVAISMYRVFLRALSGCLIDGGSEISNTILGPL